MKTRLGFVRQELSGGLVRETRPESVGEPDIVPGKIGRRE